jgi:hypothetical protein
MPPINFPDPPFGGLVTVKPNTENGSLTNYKTSAEAVAGSTVTGTTLEGSACQYKEVTGKVTFVAGKYSCDFTPPAEGSACEYHGSKGTVTLIKGARYCKISEAEASSTDTIVQREKDAVVSAETQAAQLQATADRAAARIQASSSAKRMMVDAVRSRTEQEAKSLLLSNGFTEKQLESASVSFEDHTGGGKGGGGDLDRVKITIRADCCPIVITIIIEF